jgi:hypothetical protein
MINMVKNIAKPIIAIFGGACCVPKACLSNANTTTVLKKEVVEITKKGNKVIDDIRTITLTEELKPCSDIKDPRSGVCTAV